MPAPLAFYSASAVFVVFFLGAAYKLDGESTRSWCGKVKNLEAELAALRSRVARLDVTLMHERDSVDGRTYVIDAFLDPPDFDAAVNHELSWLREQGVADYISGQYLERYREYLERAYSKALVHRGWLFDLTPTLSNVGEVSADNVRIQMDFNGNARLAFSFEEHSFDNPNEELNKPNRPSPYGFISPIDYMDLALIPDLSGMAHRGPVRGPYEIPGDHSLRVEYDVDHINPAQDELGMERMAIWLGDEPSNRRVDVDVTIRAKDLYPPITKRISFDVKVEGS